MNVIGQAILDACRGMDTLLDNGDFYIGTDIPAGKANNLAQACTSAGVMVPKTGFIAIMDCTVFGSCKNGLGIGESGFCTHNDWTAESASGFVPWGDFLAAGHVRKNAMQEVRFLRASKIGIDLSGSDLGCRDCIALFERIREAIQPLIGIPSASPVVSPVPQSFVLPGNWTCAWCGRANSWANHCQGCGAPSPET